jgi:hypothetical protein
MGKLLFDGCQQQAWTRSTQVSFPRETVAASLIAPLPQIQRHFAEPADDGEAHAACQDGEHDAGLSFAGRLRLPILGADRPAALRSSGRPSRIRGRAQGQAEEQCR